MKKLSFMIFLITNALSSQAISKENLSWIKYYAYVDTAEIAIVDSMYTKALFYYEKAFRLVDHPFGKDYFNAVLCADHLNKPKQAVHYMLKLAEKGLEIKYFEDNPYLKNVTQSNQWKQFVKKYPSCRDKYLKDTVAIALRKEFKKMSERDQYYNNRRMEFGYEDSIYFVTYKHIQRIIEITSKYGFPGEEIIGLTNLPSDIIYSFLLIHFQQSKAYFNQPKFIARKEACLKNGIDYNNIDLINILKKAVWEGKYHPNLLSSLYSTNKYGNCIMLQVNDTISIINYIENVKMKIDSARREIGLCSLEMHVKKGLYSLDKLDHFRGKLKTETTSEYKKYLESKNTLVNNFNFGLPNTYMQWYFVDGDKQHKRFLSMLSKIENSYDL